MRLAAYSAAADRHKTWLLNLSTLRLQHTIPRLRPTNNSCSGTHCLFSFVVLLLLS